MKTITRVGLAAVIAVVLIGGSSVAGFAQCPCYVNCPAGDGGITAAAPGGHKSPDLNADTMVNITDLAIFASAWPPGPYMYCADYNCDGVIAIADLAIFAAHWLHAGPKPGYNAPAIDHYKLYENDGTVVTRLLRLKDQFGEIWLDNEPLFMEKFATPVMKNGEEMCDTLAHQSWWRFDRPQPPRLVQIQNQFHTTEWFVGDARYLVLPALKNEPTGLPLPELNHYLCYEAWGDSIGVGVHLVDQFGEVFVGIALPRLFCNPCQKETEDGLVWPIIDRRAHMACYLFDRPLPYSIQAFMRDQFWEGPVFLFESRILCVPTMKLWWEEQPGTSSEWQRIKALYE